jgi:hypothetical protein
MPVAAEACKQPMQLLSGYQNQSYAETVADIGHFSKAHYLRVIFPAETLKQFAKTFPTLFQAVNIQDCYVLEFTYQHHGFRTKLTFLHRSAIKMMVFN